jgi:tetratricopeptide (TPR) repeat protein
LAGLPHGEGIGFMKADERHRLAENELVKGLNRLASGSKRPPNMVLFMVGLLVVVVLVYWYWSSTAASRVSQAWINFANKRNSIEEAPESLKSGPAGQAVLLAQADAAFDRGFSKLFSDPQGSLQDFDQAAQSYDALSKQTTNNDMQLRALVGMGKAYESAGKVDQATAAYQAALNKFEKSSEFAHHPLVLDAKQHLDKLTSGDAGLGVLYKTWAEKLKQVTTTPEQQPPANLTVPNIPIPPEPIKN